MPICSGRGGSQFVLYFIEAWEKGAMLTDDEKAFLSNEILKEEEEDERSEEDIEENEDSDDPSDEN